MAVPGLARISEAEGFLRLSRSKIYELMDDGSLSFVKIGKSRRISWAELEAFVEKHTVTERSIGAIVDDLPASDAKQKDGAS